MPTRRSLKESSLGKPQEGKEASARPSAKGKRVASVHAAAPATESEEKPAPSQEVASPVSAPGAPEAAALAPSPAPAGESMAQRAAGESSSSVGKTPDERQEASGKKAPAKRPSARGKRASAKSSASGASSKGAEKEGEPKKGKPSRRAAGKKKRSPLRIALAVTGGVVAALVVVSAAFLIDRWALHDDAADLQGTWYIYGTNVVVPIDQNSIGLSSDTSYKYTMDTQAKTVTYTIGNLSGTSHYRFSSDRSLVALIEDGKHVFTATLLDDVSWWFTSAGNAISGKPVLPGPQQSNVVMLSRAPSVPASVVGSPTEEGESPEADDAAESAEESEEQE